MQPRRHGSPSSSSSEGSPSGHHQYRVSDGIISYYSSPSHSFHATCWSPVAATPESRSGSILFPSYKEGCLGPGTSLGPCSIDSTSSHSDGGENERNGMLHFLPSHRNFSGLYSFMSKPVYPVPFAAQATEAGGYGTDSICTSSRLVSADGRNSFRWPDNSVQHEKSESFSEFGSTLARSLCAEGVKCGLCERWLAQKSPWSSHKMIRSGDLPASSVLSCGHVYHADCLEQTIPETRKHDPPCPSCGGALKIPSVSDFEQSAPVNGQEMISAFGGKFPKFRIASDDDSPSSSENQNYIHSAYVTDVSGRKWHMQKPGHDKKSFLSRTLSRRHFFEGKTHKQLSAVELGLESGGSSMHVYHDNRLTHHLPSG